MNKLTTQLEENTDISYPTTITCIHSDIQPIKKTLPSQTSTGDCWGSAGAWGMGIRPPSLPWHQNTERPWDPTAILNRSLDRSAAVTREIVFATVCNLTDFDFHQCSHGYLAASPAAWCYVHVSALQALPSRVVSTAASADIVQLQRGTNRTAELQSQLAVGVCVCVSVSLCVPRLRVQVCPEGRKVVDKLPSGTSGSSYIPDFSSGADALLYLGSQTAGAKININPQQKTC